MPRPTIKGSAPKPAVITAPKPTGLPKPRAKPKEEKPDLEAAQAAVQEFETQHRVLVEMRQDWNENFPEAKLALDDIKRQEDLVFDAINKAKPLVAKAKETVGDFKAQRKYSKPLYDPEEVTKLVRDLEEGLNIFSEMLDAGIIKVIDLDREPALAWFAQRPDYAKAFEPAFKEEQEMTTAVTVPKV